MINQSILGHKFVFLIKKAGEITAIDTNANQSHDIQYLLFSVEHEFIFIIAERTNLTFKRDAASNEYILSCYTIIKTEQYKNTGMYLPGAETYEL